MPRNRRRGAEVFLSLSALVLLIGGCRGSDGKAQTGGTPPASAQSAPPAPTVQVTEVEKRDVAVTSEWIASMDGYVNAQIQPHVSGYLIRQNYREGSVVHQGDTLFEIDPRPFQAALQQSQAQLAQAKAQLTQVQAQVTQAQAQIVQAQAQLAKTNQDVTRDTPLAEAKAIAQSRLDDDLQAKAGATAAVSAAQATAAGSQAAVGASQSAIAAAQAGVEQSELNLSYTKITSLVDGVAGIAKAQIGDLVSSTTVLTTVSQLDPIKVYFPISEQDYLHTQKIGSGRGTASEPPLTGVALTLVLSDGSTYPHTGKVLWADRQIDTSTGTIRVAASFPNPGNFLRPGQYGRVRAVTQQIHEALLVPQAGVTELQGNFQVAVVNSDNKVEIRPAKIGAQVEGKWVVTEGVSFGDRVVVGGLQYAQPGTTVKPVAATTTPKER